MGEIIKIRVEGGGRGELWKITEIDLVSIILQGKMGHGDGAVYYTGPQSFIIAFSYSLT